MSVLSPLSMATTTTATPTQFTSSALCTKLSNLTFPHTHLLPISLKPKSLHPLRLKARSFIFLSPLRCTNESLEVEAEESESLTEEKHVEENEEVEEEEEKKVQEDGEEARLYVGNLPYSMTSSEVADVFAQAGTVANVEVMYDRVTDRSRGFAFVTMGSVEEAKEVIRMFDGSQVGGRTVKVNFPEVPKGGERKVLGPRIRESYKNFVDSPHKIYAGNLGWRLTSDGLKNAFAGQPGFLSAKVIYERDTGRSRGFGFVTFESADDVQTALNAMNGVEVEGRPLRLNLAAERAPSPPSASNSETSVESSELITSGSA